MVGTCHCRLQGRFCSRGSAAAWFCGHLSFLPGRKIYQHYHTITANPHIPSDISFGFQFKLDLDIIPQNTTYCSVAQSKEIKVFICNFLSHLSVNVSSYKHFMAIYLYRAYCWLYLHSIKRKVYRFHVHGYIWHLYQSIDIRAEHNLHSASASKPKDTSLFISALVNLLNSIANCINVYLL